ncbi:MAG: peptidase [Ruminococcus sp.]|nr:peptidase [Ruminococcus sp.]
MVNKKTVCAVLCALLTASAAGCVADNATGQTADSGMAVNSSVENVQIIDLEEAKSIALEHSGLSENDVVFVETKLERDNGRYEYDIEFTSNNVKYEYEIDADSGNVLGFSSESISESRGDAGNSLSGDGSQQLTLDEAKAVALEHAGFAADQVVFTKSELDYDDGIAEYEIEFKANGLEYEYKINASTGKIIEFDIGD